MTTTCHWCDGVVSSDGFAAHLASCPSAPKPPPRTKNKMLAALGSSFRIEEEE